MGQKMVGTTLRAHRITLRLNDAERDELEEKRARRRMDASDYLRTLVKEDSDD